MVSVLIRKHRGETEKRRWPSADGAQTGVAQTSLFWFSATENPTIHRLKFLCLLQYVSLSPELFLYYYYLLLKPFLSI